MNKIFIKTFGCTLNQKDSEEITKYNQLTDDIKKAKYIIINTCGVKEQTETKIINYLKDLKKQKIPNKKLIICGCLVKINKDSLTNIYPKANYFNVSEIKKIQDLIKTKKKIKKENKQITKTIIIANGCLGACSYCAVKFARGTLDSNPIQKIVNEIKTELKKGSKEFLLTAQDTGCYGMDINTDIIKLLKEIINIKGDFKVRIGMGNPTYFKRYKKELVKILKSDKIYNFLHIPIQSADNDILKKMNRFYTKREAKRLIKYFKRKIKNITIATDIIVGFPTETYKQYKKTYDFIKKTKPDIVNISRFGRRKGIEANKYEDLKGYIKKERSREITKLCQEISYKNNKKFINKKLNALVIKKGKNNTYVCMSDEYKQIIVKDKVKLGEFIEIRVISYKTHYLIGKKVQKTNKN